MKAKRRIYIKIKIDVKLIEIGSSHTKFEINLGAFLFGKIKVLGLNLFEDRIEFLGKKISYEKFRNIISNKKKGRIRTNDMQKYFKIIKVLSPKLEELDFKLNIKFEDVFLTTFAIVVLSSVLSFIVNNRIGKYKYIILPDSKNSNIIDLKGNCVMSVKLLNVIKAISMLHILHNNLFYISFYKQL